MSEWRSIPGYPDYEVSDQGQVRSFKSGSAVLMRGGRTQCRMGYIRFTLTNVKGKKVLRNLHTLVLEAFVSPRPIGKWGLHRDGDVTRNDVSNLYWGSPSDNGFDRVSHGNSGRGAQNPRATLSENEVADIRRAYRAGGVKQSDLGLRYGVQQAHISRIVRGESWSHIQ